MMKTADLIARAGRQLQDAGLVHWSAVALLDYLNTGVRKIMTALPEKFVVVANMQLAAGAQQSVPDTVMVFGGLVRNMGADGATPGPIITMAHQPTVDIYTPNWRNTTGRVIFEWMPAGDRTFLVNPPPAAATYAEARVVNTPAALTNATDEAIPLPDMYEGALLNYVLMMAHSEERNESSLALAGAHSTAFNQAIGG